MASELKFGVAEWIGFLGEWNHDALEALRQAPPDSLSELAQSALELGSILRAPATEAAVQGAEFVHADDNKSDREDIAQY